MPYPGHILSGIAGMISPSPTIAVGLPGVVKDHQHRQADLKIVQIGKPFVHYLQRLWFYQSPLSLLLLRLFDVISTRKVANNLIFSPINYRLS